MKIIQLDNFDRDTVDDSLVCENVSKYYGEILVDALNDRTSTTSEDFFRLVEDDYVLYEYEW